MAIMFPEKPRADTKSFAERALFDAFQKKLPDSYRVYHSVAWQVHNQRSGIEDGEADFVVMDPDGCLLVVEVKGGNISYDSSSDEWRSNGELIKKDPFRQGVKAKKSLLGKLRESLGNSIYFHIGNAVAFPDIVVEESLGLDKPRNIILDANDINSLYTKVKSIFAAMMQDAYLTVSGENDLREKIMAVLHPPSRQFSESIKAYFAKMNEVVDELTEEQFVVLDYLKRHRRVAISGSAGSGKTLVAIEKAIRLNQEGFSVLVLCHNPYLADTIRLRLKGTTVKAASFKELVDTIVQRPNSEAPLLSGLVPGRAPWTQYEGPSDIDLQLALDNLINGNMGFDAVIVDEGQDFSDNWWVIIEACLREPENAILYAFYDERQLLSPISQLRWVFPQDPLDLSRNCRNTGEIYKLVQQLSYSMPEPSEKLKGKGIVSEWIYSSEAELLSKLGDALLDAERYSTGLQGIVVITAEVMPVEESKFNGFIFSSPELSKSINPTPIYWQRAVIKYLKPKGFGEDWLSNQLLPSEQDATTVKRFCGEWLDRRRGLPMYNGKGLIKQVPYNWAMDSYGNLFLQNRGVHVGISDEWEIMVFFSNRDWPRTLPRPKRMYRLTPINEFGKFPYYENIQLTNIPSFKGLESNGAVFVYYDYSGGYDTFLMSSLYVGLSRAKHLLNIVSPKPIQEEITRLNQLIAH